MTQNNDFQNQHVNSNLNENLWVILKSFFYEKGLVRHQIDSFNDFIQNNMQEIIDDMPPVIANIPVKKNLFGNEKIIENKIVIWPITSF